MKYVNIINIQIFRYRKIEIFATTATAINGQHIIISSTVWIWWRRCCGWWWCCSWTSLQSPNVESNFTISGKSVRSVGKATTGFIPEMKSLLMTYTVTHASDWHLMKSQFVVFSIHVIIKVWRCIVGYHPSANLITQCSIIIGFIESCSLKVIAVCSDMTKVSKGITLYQSKVVFWCSLYMFMFSVFFIFVCRFLNQTGGPIQLIVTLRKFLIYALF